MYPTLSIGDIVKIDTSQLRLSWSASDNPLLPDHGKLGIVSGKIREQHIGGYEFYSVYVSGKTVVFKRVELIKVRSDGTS